MRTRIAFPLLACSLTALCAPAAVTIDRMAVVVGKHVIKTSDIQRDIRLTAFLNRQKMDFAPQARRESAERLIDQEIIRQEIITGGYRRPAASEADALQATLVRDRFNGSDAQFGQALASYGLTREELRERLLWQLTVLHFIDQRFRAGVYVSDEDVEQYDQQHQAELRKQNPGLTADALKAKSREQLEGERVNQNFDAWLEETRKRTNIQYKQEAFA
jgi:hypothetical protein